MARIAATSHVIKALMAAHPDLCFYKMSGAWQVRRRHSLTARRVANDPAFLFTRLYAGILGQASGLAASVLQGIPKTQRGKGITKRMDSMACKALKAGQLPASVMLQLEQAFLPATPKADAMAAQPLKVQDPAKACNATSSLPSFAIILHPRRDCPGAPAVLA
ncbi:hypothetical protein GA0116948_109107 [Chitinophaga costaii]|uniref:Uncharacterized protein n=1 Tax=Chitinophaga costaii TaxID=1335309 RepID=A0A1C4EQ95_9BACT|nr:hypothetical protein [Chitinophaga costaii]PUZ22511.1 hypothetical protein DCM91_14680 [Chitinophaga costaii]SCC45702.1 hypothetical protein GA0116948_109107 [Chitinophaga costaii]